MSRQRQRQVSAEGTKNIFNPKKYFKSSHYAIQRVSRWSAVTADDHASLKFLSNWLLRFNVCWVRGTLCDVAENGRVFHSRKSQRQRKFLSSICNFSVWKRRFWTLWTFFLIKAIKECQNIWLRSSIIAATSSTHVNFSSLCNFSFASCRIAFAPLKLHLVQFQSSERQKQARILRWRLTRLRKRRCQDSLAVIDQTWRKPHSTSSLDRKQSKTECCRVFGSPLWSRALLAHLQLRSNKNKLLLVPQSMSGEWRNRER